jgi:hypothetical protein
VIDLMTLLKKSLDKQGGRSGDAERPQRRPPARARRAASADRRRRRA